MPTAQFPLAIEASDIERYYRGIARNILVTTTTGLKIQFPANLILPYVTRYGVHGQFLLSYDQNGKAQSLQRL